MFDVPQPAEANQVVVDVLAAGLHPRVRSGAAGAHYTSTGRLPMVPGVDAVGQRPDGQRIYFVADDDAVGTMADKAVADMRCAVELPDGADVVKIAAAMNPAMSSWVALRQRVPLQPGQSVLVLGATGNAGTMAVRISRLLGAGRVVGAGRDPGRLCAVADAGADDIVRLTTDDDGTGRALAAAAAEVDIVIDYLWGPPGDRAAVGRPALGQPAPAGQRSGLGLPASYRAELPALIDAIDSGAVPVTTIAVPLAEVESAWTRADPPGQRTVLIP